MRLPLFLRFTSFVGPLLALTVTARATDGTWGTTVLGGAATWNDTANWSASTVADGVGAVATFNQDFSANLQFTFPAPVTIGSISATDTSAANPDRGLWLNSGSITFAAASGTPSITVTADTLGGNHDIPLRFNGATLLGTQGLIINLDGANYNGLSAGARFSAGNWSGFSGPVTLQTGRFRVEAASNTLPPNSEIILGPGVWFQIVRGYTGGLGSQSIRGLSGGDATTLAGAENSANDPAAAGTLTLGATALSSDAYAFSGSLGGDMFGTGSPNTNFSVTKSGPGLQRLNGSSLYTGVTTVSGGTLLVNGTHTQGTGANAGRYLVTSGATLGGHGTVILSDTNAGTTGVSLSGVLSPGDPLVNSGIGTFTVNAANSARSAFAFETGATLAIRLGAANSASRVAFTSASTNEVFFNNTVVHFTDLTAGGLSSGHYTLVSADASGAFNGLTLDGSGFITAGLSIGSGLGNYPGSTLQVVGNNLVLNLVVPAGPPPAAPENVIVTSGFDQVALSWDAVSGAGSYTIKRSTTSGSGYVTIATGITGTSYTDTTATPGVTYYYVVLAVNGNGESSPGAEGSGVSTVRAAIGINLRAYNTYGLPVTDLAGIVRKSWWNNLVGPAATGESVTLATLVDHLGDPVSGLGVTFTAGTGNGTLKLGSDAVTVGPASNDLNLYSSVFDQYNGTASTLNVSGIPYTSYDLVVYVYDGGSARGGVVSANGTTFALRGGAGNPAADGTGYVRSTDSVNTSGSSVQPGNYVRFTGLSGTLTATLAATNMGDSTQRLKIAGFQILSNDANPSPTAAPATPAGLTASGGNRQVALNWSRAATATSYRVHRGGTFLAAVTAPVYSYADTSVVNGTAYTYTVSAVNAIGESAVSSGATATPAAPGFTATARSVYQYSNPVTAIYSSRAADPMRRAYLWVPPGATRLQGVIVGLHNMLEKPMFEDPTIRQACTDAGLGIVFISPGDAKTWTASGVGNYTSGQHTTALDLDPHNYTPLEINPATGVAFTSGSEQAAAELAEILRRLGVESGYSELQYAPILLAGHSAASPFVWTRAVHTSTTLGSRVFALLPYKGTFAGSVPNGLPVLHVASEWQEISQWGNTWEVGDAPSARGLRSGGTDRLVSEFVQPGTGHYQYSETQSAPIATFIRRAAYHRIPTNWTTTAAPTLNSLSASSGYLVDVTSLGSGNATPVAYADWIAAGKDPLRAYWFLDQETARAACDVMNTGFAKKPQLISAFSNATTLPDLATQSNSAGTISHSATLQADGVTFQLRTASLNQSPIPKLFHGAPVGIASGSILLKVNGSGALKQTGVDTFRVWFDRGSIIKTGQPWEPFVIAWHPGDTSYREADRPIQLSTSVPVNLTGYSGGSTQTLTFTSIPNQTPDALPVLSLAATSSAGAGYPVQYWMVSGPYRNDEIDSGILVPDTIPAGSKFPLRVIVGAWQWGKPGVLQSATPVYRTFWIFQNAFQKWRFDQFGSYDADGVPVTPAGSSDTTADPDGDGLNNLLEYALGGNPTEPDADLNPAAAATETRLQLTFNRIADPALLYTVQATDNLTTTWADIWTSTGADNVAGLVTVPDTQLLSTSARRFLRLRVSM